MNKVFVLDTNKQPLDLCHPGQARRLLKAGLAAVYNRFPFTIILKRAVDLPELQPYRLKLDPGSKKTGVAIINERTGEVVFAAELEHRGQQIKDSLDSRRGVRRGRRTRNTRYRKPRFDNRTRKPGCLPPSLESRVSNIMTWVRRLCRLCPICAISQELVKFDTQLMQNAEISSISYQQGELAGYEIREYLLEKFNRQCAYCKARDKPMQVEHIIPRSRGGTDRVSNLTIACQGCNQEKNNLTAEEFGYPDVQRQALKPLKDAAAVNTTRWELYRRLQSTGLPVEVGTGGRTKFNRTHMDLPKTHWIDAACVGASTPEKLDITGVKPLEIKATGHGSRQMCKMDKLGFPRTGKKAGNRFFGFRTGDIARAVVTKGKKIGTYTGKVAIRATGSFNITTKLKTIQGINYRFCKLIHASDGYSYAKGDGASSTAKIKPFGRGLRAED